MRALLLFNPNATTTDDRVRDVIAAALASELDLETQPTKQRGHATHIAAGAVHAGFDAVFALGGDGTANEVIQALAGTSVAFAPIPGGGANVFARALGLPNDAVHATGQLLEAIRDGRERRIGLGRANGRYFGFNAGFGFDAAVVRSIEQRPGMKRRLRQAAFVLLATREWATSTDRRAAEISLAIGDAPPSGAYAVCIIGNTDPYTFLGRRPMRVTPQAGFDTGLDLLALEALSTPALLRVVARVFGSAGHVDDPRATHLHDVADCTLLAPSPQPLMVDGDYAGEHTRVRLESAPRALRVVF